MDDDASTVMKILDMIWQALIEFSSWAMALPLSLYFQSEELDVVSLGAPNGHSLKRHYVCLLLMHLILQLDSQATPGYRLFYLSTPYCEFSWSSAGARSSTSVIQACGWDCPCGHDRRLMTSTCPLCYMISAAGRKLGARKDCLTSVSRHSADGYKQHLEEHLCPYIMHQRYPSTVWYLLCLWVTEG